MDIDLNQLLADLENLRHRPKIDPEDKALLTQYQIEVANYEALIILKRNPVFVGLIDTFAEQIKRINGWILTNSKEMLMNPEKQREAMLMIAKRDVYQEFVEHFNTDPSGLIEKIQNRVNHFIKK